jgi:hypothetical protein
VPATYEVLEIERLRGQVRSLERRCEELSSQLDYWFGVAQEQSERLPVALRQILEDPDAKILDSHREDGWEALGKSVL